MPYQVTEPHPTVKSATKTAYIGSGIGGAGNLRRYDTTNLTSGPAATGPASRAMLPAPPNTIFAGRGGAGNAYKPSATRPSIASSTHRTSSESSTSSAEGISPAQRAIFSFDEELEREQRMRDNAAKVYHIGRGGAGNAMPSVVPRKSSSASSSVGSSASSEGKRRSMMDRISRTLSRN
ncbi:hypothetical protein CAC42_1866 [Sphaceloma murrayae]|uniref:Uncharacterized protein n=1 Tax=Sphaceloma murrayae TaxID=2082308 RepID=A0A2K1QW02_9PEZI|nr:hypothetical protein CAC42_1866 [Sphaceloma murrayae]